MADLVWGLRGGGPGDLGSAKLKGAQDYAGTWTEKKKDGTKGGQTLNVNQVGPCMFMTHSCDGCPTGIACAYPLGGGLFCSEPFALYCGPMCMCPNPDGTFSDGCGTTYAKYEAQGQAQGAPMGSAEMER